MTTIIGLKLLRADGTSLREEGRVTYPINEWIEVPGNGSYVAISDGIALNSAGTGSLLVALECDEPTGADAPAGTVCYRRVRRIGNGIAYAPAWTEYERPCDAAWTDYKRAHDIARAEYERACDTAWAEHERECHAAWNGLVERSKAEGRE